MERCLRIRSRRIQSELDEVDLDEKISKMQREISKLAIETKLLQDRTESYRLEAGEKVAIRKTNAETLKKTLDEREAFCNTQMAIIEELDRSLNEKTAMLNELKMEIHGGALPVFHLIVAVSGFLFRTFLINPLSSPCALLPQLRFVLAVHRLP